uniref:hypothetical protein n=1 Tax=Polynucleobacter sp. TaxID=2029855 RepID=UPI004048DBFD
MSNPQKLNPMDTKFRRTMIWLKFSIVVFPIALAGQVWILVQDYSFTNLVFVLITAFALYTSFRQYGKFKAYLADLKDQEQK